MGRPAKITKPIHFHTTVSEPLFLRLQLYLFSEMEQAVPRGAYQEWLESRIVEFFDHPRLDVSAYVGQTNGCVVRGDRRTIELLEQVLKGSKT